jgi:hypothetical protein
VYLHEEMRVTVFLMPVLTHDVVARNQASSRVVLISVVT